MTTETASNEYESKVDTEIARLWDVYFNLTRPVDQAVDAIHYAVNDKKIKLRREPVRWTLTLDQAIEKLAEREPKSWEKPNEYYTDRLAEARAALSGALAAVKEEEKLYTGWNRFFLVPGGHIHSSRQCSTCYPTTMFSWLPALSGLTERDAVMTHGPLLCSVCYPSAPVEWTVGPEKPEYCEGSGHSPAKTDKPWLRYQPCAKCGYFAALTPSGVVRKHVAKAAA